MRKCREQTTILRMMIAIAVAAVAMGAAVGVWRRHTYFLFLASHHEQCAAEFADKAEGWRGGASLLWASDALARKDAHPDPPFAPLDVPDTEVDVASPVDPLIVEMEGFAEGFDGLAHHHAGLGKKYRRAASRPWMPVEPDPSPPRAPVEPPADSF